MASRALPLGQHGDFTSVEPKVYTVCFFDRGNVVPRVKLVDAASDEQAISEACSMNRWTRREVWDRHRFVASIQSAD